MTNASEQTFTYVVAIGSNRPLSARLHPTALVDAAIDALDSPPLHLLARSHTIRSAPLGPSRRHYANAVAIVASSLPPPALLDRLQAIERNHGRRRRQRWGARTLDLDIILWSGGIWTDPRLTVPHPAFRMRDFVLAPLAMLAPQWRDPGTGRTVAQLRRRLIARKPVDPRANPL
ncbi:2-amino-4-hydroxy-6-hydroxymethyldihydropteridine diphosphokinase [Sphingobium algorifonticola]|uniref:2-amino-4-hydroxy-6-hydroxymethyldihydropteridine pyrophosphokinase n=1 Tax=Sphingobium algorifonticola TaxID=2008318 RepID=A0A437J6Q0_9SPHN|nr:2-amino-4-hydroxy-6-hydroxymethyldihydropteridine diphosphokinase [Sphingobium algorifonticola]RVT40845.1 2-amino-4-hydroxy-6-hydroxymethyldihydropteridine diphosphokinase [Sphingobium algorifonticola]